MERRKFIQAALISTSAPLTASAARLYGTPKSLEVGGGTVEEKFILPLSRFGAPSEAIRVLSSATQVIENVLTSEHEASAFSSDPKKYLESFGLDASDGTLRDDTVIMIASLSHPAVKESLAKSDYSALFEYLSAAGLFEPRSQKQLQKQIEKSILDNIEAIQNEINEKSSSLSLDRDGLMMKFIQDSGTHATEDDLAVISQLINPEGGMHIMCTAVAMCAVAVGIAAVAAIYVSVVVAATIGVLAGVGVSVAVAVAITVGGGGGGGCMDCPPIDIARRSTPFTGNFAKFDPALMRNTERALRLAALGGDQELKVHALKEMLSAEVRAVVGALQSTKLLSLPEEQALNVTDAMIRYAHRSLGI